MIRLSPYDPEIEAVWRALVAANARSVAIVAADPGEGTTLLAGAIARRAGLSSPARDLALREASRVFTVDRRAGPARGTPAMPADGAARGPDGRVLPGLLVDLNLTRPAVSRLLGLRPRPGEIIRLEALGLAVLGDPGVDGADGWREPAMISARLVGWRQQWSMVVFDTAPLRSREEGALSAVTVAQAADATILVTLAGRTPASHIREARDALTTAGARLIGTVLNDRDNPSLLSEMERETDRFSPLFPRLMAGLRRRMRSSALLGVRV